VLLSAARWADLKAVNLSVNRSIAPDRDPRRSPIDPWLINPTHGNCSDYAVSKRHALIKRGWPARTLLLSEVETSWGEHHLVLVVRTKVGDLVLDNLTAQITPWTRAPYLWIRIQLPNTQYWDTVASGRA
jgi:predicted transglutaminase-like cysteine proteinase